MRLEAHAIAASLPRGWDGRIHGRPPETISGPTPLRRSIAAHTPATLHAASFALPPRDGDFGSHATAAMSAGDAFLALTEYIEGNGLRAGTGLFRSGHIPRELAPAMFSPRTLLVGRPGQSGFQHFLTVAGRPFCLYAVIAPPPASASLQGLNAVLSTLRVESRTR